MDLAQLGTSCTGAARQALFHIITDCTICLVTARIIAMLKTASHDSSDLVLETMSNLCHLTLVKVAGEGGCIKAHGGHILVPETQNCFPIIFPTIFSNTDQNEPHHLATHGMPD